MAHFDIHFFSDPGRHIVNTQLPGDMVGDALGNILECKSPEAARQDVSQMKTQLSVAIGGAEDSEKALLEQRLNQVLATEAQLIKLGGTFMLIGLCCVGAYWLWHASLSDWWANSGRDKLYAAGLNVTNALRRLV